MSQAHKIQKSDSALDSQACKMLKRYNKRLRFRQSIKDKLGDLATIFSNYNFRSFIVFMCWKLGPLVPLLNDYFPL